MATAGEMIRIIGHALARPSATVTSYYGVLRKAGMISTTGRGRSAQDLAPLDVARILIVMLSADSLQEGAAITDLVGALGAQRGDEDYNVDFEIDFEDALARLLEFKAAHLSGRAKEDDGSLGDLSSERIEVRVTATHLRAEMVVGGDVIPFFHLGAQNPGMTYPDDWEEISMEDRLVLRAMMEGMSVTRAVDGFVIKQVALGMAKGSGQA